MELKTGSYLQISTMIPCCSHLKSLPPSFAQMLWYGPPAHGQSCCLSSLAQLKKALRMRQSTRMHVELCDAIRDAGWTVVLRPIEVGARGFVARSVSRLLRELGLSSREVTTLCRSLATVVARCSFTIYLASSSAEWHMRDLLQ